MEIKHYTYEDFVFFSLSFFGLQSLVFETLKNKNLEEINIKKINDLMSECSTLDLSDRARFFRILYRRFYKKNRITKDKLITDMLQYCS